MNDKKTQKELGQFFTPPPVAGLVTSGIDGQIKNAIDLAAGAGDLLIAVRSAHPLAQLSALDLDPVSISYLKEHFPTATITEADTLNLCDQNQDWLLRNEFDLVVGNPPYNKQKASAWTLEVIRSELGIDCRRYSSVRAEIAFLALSLLAVQHKGYLSLVLPKTLLVGDSFQWLRDCLIKKHSVISVASLPSRVFQNTEVETCVLTLQKGVATSDQIQIIHCDKVGCEIDKVFISPKEGIYRLDYEYHHWKAENLSECSETLAEAGVQIVRGNIHSKKAKELGINIFHTSNFSMIDEGVIHFSLPPEENDLKLVSVEKGDILLPRVGRNLHHVAKVASGKSVISDCVFSLRAPESRIDDLHCFLESKHAKSWIDVHTSGACAKILSKANLLNMPLMK